MHWMGNVLFGRLESGMVCCAVEEWVECLGSGLDGNTWSRECLKGLILSNGGSGRVCPTQRRMASWMAWTWSDFLHTMNVGRVMMSWVLSCLPRTCTLICEWQMQLSSDQLTCTHTCTVETWLMDQDFQCGFLFFFFNFFFPKFCN